MNDNEKELFRQALHLVGNDVATLPDGFIEKIGERVAAERRRRELRSDRRIMAVCIVVAILGFGLLAVVMQLLLFDFGAVAASARNAVTSIDIAGIFTLDNTDPQILFTCLPSLLLCLFVQLWFLLRRYRNVQQ